MMNFVSYLLIFRLTYFIFKADKFKQEYEIRF